MTHPVQSKDSIQDYDAILTPLVLVELSWVNL